MEGGGWRVEVSSIFLEIRRKIELRRKACKAWKANIGEGNDVTSDPYGNQTRSTFDRHDGQNSL